MLEVVAGEFRHPVALFVLAVADDALFHGSRHRLQKKGREEGPIRFSGHELPITIGRGTTLAIANTVEASGKAAV